MRNLFQFRATISAETNWRKATGAQIRSILLGVMIFITVPRAKNTTTNQTAIPENDSRAGKYMPAADKTTIAKNDSTSAFTTATNRIFGGYFPGNFPPMEAAPQGTPAASSPWKITKIPVRMVKVIADAVINNLKSGFIINYN
jgi:hypothetical protein